jgi:hypothetical protein
LFIATPEAGWQHDCFYGALVFGGISSILLALPLALVRLCPIRAKIPELLIWAIFGINTIFFSLGMARTGGPSHSFFSRLVPIQLSGILLLQLQKVMITRIKANIWTFGAGATFSIITWLVVVLFPTPIVQIVGWGKFSAEPSLESFASFAVTVLFVLFAYWLPLQPWFIDFISRNLHVAETS